MSKRSASEAELDAPQKDKLSKAESSNAAPDDMDEAAKLIQNVTNTDPTGLPAAQRYFKQKVEQVELFVGGKRFKTSRETLTSIQGSHLADLFTKDGPKEAKKNDKGSYELPDRPGTHFMFILNYLRDREIDVPADKNVFQEIETEAKYYGLTHLLQLLHEGSGGAQLNSGGESATTVLKEPKDFDGKDFVAVTPTFPASAATNTSFTITLFIQVTKKPKKNTQVPIFHKGSNKDQVAGSLFLTGERQLVVCLCDQIDSEDNLTSQASLDLKTSVHIGIVFDKGSCSLYVDDIKDSTVPLKDTAARDAIMATNSPFKVGGSDSFGKTKTGISGSIWALTVHHKALSPEELAKDRTENEEEK